jgi:hypothetical protein
MTTKQHRIFQHFSSYSFFECLFALMFDKTEASKLLSKLAHLSADVGSAPVLRRRVALLSLCSGEGAQVTERGPVDATPAFIPPQLSAAFKPQSVALAKLVEAYFDFYTDAVRFRTAVSFLHLSKVFAMTDR